jgi:hypothetical protein
MLAAIETLPADATIEDAIERLVCARYEPTSPEILWRMPI